MKTKNNKFDVYKSQLSLELDSKSKNKILFGNVQFDVNDHKEQTKTKNKRGLNP